MNEKIVKSDVVLLDWDFNLLNYNFDETMEMIFHLMMKYLVEKHSYPQSFKDLKATLYLLPKGLVIDTRRGNLLKLNFNNCITWAFHGMRQMSAEELRNVYPRQIPAYSPMNADSRVPVDYFAVCMSQVFALMVQHEDMVRGLQDDYRKLWAIVVQGMEHIFNISHNVRDETTFQFHLQASPQTYLQRMSEQTLNKLTEIKQNGKVLCLLSNSDSHHLELSARYAIGNDWRTYFDFIVSSANVPWFFSNNPLRMFTNCDMAPTEDHAQVLFLHQALEKRVMYEGGNWNQLLSSICKASDKKAETVQCLYVGDTFGFTSCFDRDNFMILQSLQVEGVHKPVYAKVATEYLGPCLEINMKDHHWSNILTKCHLR